MKNDFWASFSQFLSLPQLIYQVRISYYLNKVGRYRTVFSSTQWDTQ
jgi:hypothetical protein